MNGKGAARPSLKVSNLYGMVTGMVEDSHSLVGATVIRRIVYARFLDAVNFQSGNQEADPEQESVSRWVIEQCSDLTAVSATFVRQHRLKQTDVSSREDYAGQYLYMDIPL